MVCEGGSDAVTGVGETWLRKPDDQLWMTWGKYRHDYEYVRCPIADDGSFVCATRESEEHYQSQAWDRWRTSVVDLQGKLLGKERMEVQQDAFSTCTPADQCAGRTECQNREIATLVWTEDP